MDSCVYSGVVSVDDEGFILGFVGELFIGIEAVLIKMSKYEGVWVLMLV